MVAAEFSGLWAGFRGKSGTERDRVIVGVAAAFAHVAVANGVLESSETSRFVDVVRGSRLAASDNATAIELRTALEALVHGLLGRPELGRGESTLIATKQP
jgi:tellurite resistance protein